MIVDLDQSSLPPILGMALRLSALGVAVHWLRGPTGGDEAGRGKAPISKRWQHVPWQGERTLIRTYVQGYNLGIHTGAVLGARVALLVVDCDDMEAVTWALRLPFTPLRVRTRQGLHLYYRRPATEERCPNRAKVGGLRLDIRCDDGNIVFPPSVHPSGFVYEFHGHPAGALYDAHGLLEPSTIEALPVFDYAWLPAPPPSPTLPRVDATSLGFAKLPDRTERRAIGLCRKWQVNERGKGQGTDTFKLAGMLLFNLGLTPEQTYAVIECWYNRRCPQPYTEPELRRKVQEAAIKIRDRRPRLPEHVTPRQGR
ncbi:MAG: bifunctional DNA primase/polymerase [Polyangia bacterium]